VTPDADRVIAGRYVLASRIASGGMAAVWSAQDPVLSRSVAVKILRPELSRDPEVRARFRYEAVAAAKLAHPNIVVIYDTGEDADFGAYIVMELVSGHTLRAVLTEQGALPVGDAIRIGAQVADALDYAHRAGVVHRDVKPGNILVPGRGGVKVADFGIAKTVDRSLTGDDRIDRGVLGTARYLAPEQVQGLVTDERTDVYALGLLLFEMLTGRVAFGGDSELASATARLMTVAPAIRVIRPEVPASIDDLVHRCLARDPERRPRSAGAVQAALLH
jgi:serine/threonine-protein kinase